MDKQLGGLLIVGGLIGAGYLALNKLTSSGGDLSYKMVCKITQEIKHQILIVSISFAEGAKEHYEKLQKSNPGKSEELLQYFRTKMGEIFSQKQDLILGKYGLTKQQYSTSLAKYEKDEKLVKLQKQIFDMMEASIQGQYPDLTVDQRVINSFGKQEIRQIYEEMSKMILANLLAKLKKQKGENRFFDSNSDHEFKRVIRELNIYDKKIEFFKSKGFKQQWGCPNQNFFKYSQSLKIKDPEFKTKMKKLQAIYQRLVDIASQDPMSLTLEKISEYYIQKPEEPKPQPRFSPKKEEKTQPKPEEAEEETYVHLNGSIRSEPEVENPQQKNNQIPKEEVQQIPHEEPEQIKYEDVPSDAHQLQKQLHQNAVQVHQNPQPQVNHQEILDSNASLDAEPIQAEPEHVEVSTENKQVQQEPKENNQHHEAEEKKDDQAQNN